MEDNSYNSDLENEIIKVSSKTSSYLQATARFALNNGLPLCLASAWSSKARNISTTSKRIKDRTCCISCGINLRHRRCFDLKLREADNKLTIEGVCCGCKQAYYCGEMEQSLCSEEQMSELGNVMDNSMSLDRTFDERSICVFSTPLMKYRSSPTVSPQTPNSHSQVKRIRKRRGSALERLLKEEESETDRSLSGFLNMVAKFP